MLLVIDVGNTNITLGVFEKEKLEATFRMTAKQPRTSDEYGIKLCTLLEHRGFDIEEIDAVIVSSVVPDIMHSLGSAIIKYFHTKPLYRIAKFGDRTLDKHRKSEDTGTDRIVCGCCL